MSEFELDLQLSEAQKPNDRRSAGEVLSDRMLT